MVGLRKWIGKTGVKLLVPLGAALFAGLSGCTLGGTKEEAAQVIVERPAPAPSPTVEKPVPSKAPIKEDTLESQSFKVQELSVREERGQTTLQIEFSQPVNQYRHFPLAQPSRIVLDVFGETKRLAQVDTFRVDTHWMGVLRLSSSEGYLRFVAEIAAATVPAYVIQPENGGLKIVIGEVNPQATAKKELQLVKGGKRVDVRVAEAAAPATEAKPPKAVPEPVTEEKKYTGQRISLDFKDADIKNVFRLLAEVSGKNIVVTDDVNRKVTVRLLDVPWDQAMDLLVETNGLGKEEVGNVIRISTAGRLKAERDALAAAQKAREGLEPLQTAYFNINYATVKDLEPKVKALLSGRGIMVIDQRSNTIMVRDIQKSVDDVSTLVSKLDTRTAQVLIESNLVETTPTFSRALGMELDSVFNDGRIITSSRFLAGLPFAGSPQGVGNQIIVPESGFRFGYFGNNVRGILSAAENEGLVKIISRPSVVTLNNIPSTIKSERILRIALPSSTNIASGTGAAAGTAVATEKIPVGINLTVVPQVSSDGFILMNVKVKSSSLAEGFVGGGVAGVIPFDELNREAEANVLVKDGETIVIGGILKDTDSSSESGIPYLKDIPFLGWLFKNWRVSKQFEELVVFITPRIASAGSNNLPTADELWRQQMEKTRSGTTPPSP